MFNDLSLFFDPNNGMDIVPCVIDGVDHHGYLNGVAAEFHMDNSGPGVERYTFETKEFTGWRSVVGKTVTVNSKSYTIDGIDTDGTGVLVFDLFAQ